MVAGEDERGRQVRARVLIAALLGALLAALAAAAAIDTVADASSWRVDSSFGRAGVAGLPVREGGFSYRFPPGPGDDGSLLAAGPSGSVYVGGYARSKPGVFLLARMSSSGRLVGSFGHGGLTTVPAIYSVPEKPPRMLAVAGGRVLVVGLDHAHHLVAVLFGQNGTVERAYGHDGVAKYDLASTNGHAIVAAAVVESGGDLLVVYYQREVPEPVNEPRITAGLGAGSIGLARLLPNGRLDPSFGHGGLLLSNGPPPQVGELGACGVTAAADGSVLLAYEQASSPNNGPSLPAVQELDSGGSDSSTFGQAGIAYLPFTPVVEGTDSIVCGGLFALPDGEVEASFGGGGQLIRFTTSGAPDPSFGTAGHTGAGHSVAYLALSASGEAYALDSTAPLSIRGTLADGAPDPALGGSAGMRFPVHLPTPPGGEEPELELLPMAGGLDVLVGESLVRLSG